MKCLRVSCLSLLALGLFAPAAHAATATANLTVTANVGQTCSVTTVALNFGTYDSVINAATPLDGTGLVNVTCSTGTVAMVDLGQGLNPAAGSTDATPLRQMISGTNLLAYTLYQDAGRTTIWGNTTGPTGTGVPITGTGSVIALTVYGRIAAGLTPATGVYSDTVVATVNF